MPSLRTALLALWPLMIAAVIVLSVLPGSMIPRMPLSDKQEHFSAYVGLALVPAAAIKRRGRVLVAVLSMACLGVALEFFQLRIPGRAFEWHDILSNCAGTLGGTLAGLPLRRPVIRSES
ncbi:MAG: VanZ family protein [Bryobacterales bacterium]|nr:VanZ family protein [Bryobacterales bacterium]